MPRSREEEVFYEDDDVRVTSARAILFGTTYPLANVTSVRLAIEPRPIRLAVLAACGVLLGALLISSSFPFPSISLACLVGGFILAGIYAFQPVKFWVCIGAAGGEQNACWYKKQDDAQAVVDAINDAIVDRG